MNGQSGLSLAQALDTGIEPPDWDHGRCRVLGIDPEVFFFEEDYTPRSREYHEARRLAQSICGKCPIKHECAEWAIETMQYGGVWGGMTNDDRKKVRSTRYNQALAERRLLMQGVS